MRIAVVVKSLQIGGMERAAINLADTFANEGHDTHLIYFKDKKRLLSPNKLVEVHLFKLEYILKLTIIGAILNLFAKVMNGFIRHSYFYFQGLLLTPIFKYKLKKLQKEHGEFDLVIVRGQGTFEMIWHYNSDNYIIQQVNVLRNYDTLLNNFYRRVIFSNKHIVCNAPAVMRELEKDFITSQVSPTSLEVIPSPIDRELILFKASEYPVDLDAKYIINIGRLEDVKNVSLLIDAYAYARENLGFDYDLVIIGGGNEFEMLQNKTQELDIEKFVHFKGILPNPYPWLKQAELFAFTSKNEGLPNVLLESLACQTNIVSTRGRGGTLDIMSGDLEENLTAFDVKEFAEKMLDILDSKQHIDFNKHLNNYSPTAVVNEYIKYIKKV
ncbi:MAG TPA: glycosyltransferase [Campylobacterales bacterium]|nr:glycosyltransferase [Campylobacterales bacterium]